MKQDGVYIIAEAGVNHNGSLELAKKLVDMGAEAGVDAVKFQTFRAENLTTKRAEKADYQKETTSTSETQQEMLKKLELPKDFHLELIDYCKEKGVDFLSSPFDLDSIDYLDSLGMEVLKMPSGEVTNFPYLRKIAGLGKKLIFSTGMSTLSEVGAALEVMYQYGARREDVTILHVNTEYPTPMNDVNLNAMLTLRDAFKVKVGYSDHTLGIEVPIAAVAMGACVIEKHITLDKTMEGPDHKASLDAEELKAMVKAIRNIELALGDGIKRPSESETKNIAIARKSLVSKGSIAKGERFTEENLTTKRPGNGISPMLWEQFLGKEAHRDFEDDELID